MQPNETQRYIISTYYYAKVLLRDNDNDRESAIDWLNDNIGKSSSPWRKSEATNGKWYVWDYYHNNQDPTQPMLLGVYFKNKEDAVRFKMRFI